MKKDFFSTWQHVRPAEIPEYFIFFRHFFNIPISAHQNPIDLEDFCAKNQHEKTTFAREPVWFGLVVCLVQGGENVRDEEALSGAHAEHRPHVFPLLRMRTKKI